MSFEDLIEPVRQHLMALGFELVDFRRGGTTQRPHFQVRIDRPDSSPGQGVTAEDCVHASRSLERFLEARGVSERYVLQVSSPGLERPLVWPEHWRRFRGRRVRVRGPFPGRPAARIIDVPDDAHVVLGLDDGEHTVALADISEATLVYDWEQPGKPKGRSS